MLAAPLFMRIGPVEPQQTPVCSGIRVEVRVVRTAGVENANGFFWLSLRSELRCLTQCHQLSGILLDSVHCMKANTDKNCFTEYQVM